MEVRGPRADVPWVNLPGTAIIMEHKTTCQEPGVDTRGRGPAGTPDYVVIDESGDFTYYSSVAMLLSDMEYPAEAACIVDREGNSYRLVLDERRMLRLGRSFGQAEFSWLRQAWVASRHRTRSAHCLHRLFPGSRNDLLSAMFETLPLEQEQASDVQAWSVALNDQESWLSGLAEVDAMVARVKDLVPVRVTDPFGHRYRPVRRKKRGVPARARILYMEIGSTH